MRLSFRRERIYGLSRRAGVGQNVAGALLGATAKMVENKKKPNPIDVHVGARIRLRRNILGMSQERLGESLGITFQQVQKYEKGTNRVGASRLQAIARILGAPVAFFFEDAPGRELSPGMAEDATDYVAEIPNTAEGIQLNRAFVRISDPKVRRRVLDLVKALSEESDD